MAEKDARHAPGALTLPLLCVDKAMIARGLLSLLVVVMVL